MMSVKILNKTMIYSILRRVQFSGAANQLT